MLCAPPKPTDIEGPLARALQRRQLAGHGILLARHGSHISTMGVDRGAGRVVAFLDDGSSDSAPNMIFPGFPVPSSITITGVLLEDWKFLAAVSGCWAAFIGLMVAATAAFSGLSSAELAQLLGSYPGN